MFSAKSPRQRKRRPSRKYTLSSPGEFFAERVISASNLVPAFYQDPDNPSGDIQAEASVYIPGANPDDSQDDIDEGPTAANAAASLGNVVVQYDDGSGGGGIIDDVTVTETDTVTTTAAIPAPDPGSNLRAIELTASHQNMSVVNADANGPYGIGGYADGTTARTTSPLNFIARNTDGSEIVGPATGTATISFTVSISAEDSSGPGGSARFWRYGSLDLYSSYVDIHVGYGAGVVVTDHSSGTVLASDPNFDDVVSGGGGGDPGDLSFSWSGNFPILQTLSIDYSSFLEESPAGTFNGETASFTANFGWNFTIAANP